MKTVKLELVVELNDNASVDWIIESVVNQLEENESLISYDLEVEEKA